MVERLAGSTATHDNEHACEGDDAEMDHVELEKEIAVAKAAAAEVMQELQEERDKYTFFRG